MKIKYLLIVLLQILIVVGCNKSKKIESNEVFNKKFVTIGTFNMEWLGDGINDRKPRIESDYKLYAEIIRKMDADILGVEEIENAAALEKILKYLPNYKFFISKEGGQQRVGIIFKNGIDVKLIGDYLPLEIEKRKTKPGLLIQAKAGNFDFYLMAVHFKSSSHFDDTEEKQERAVELREEQAYNLAHWADSTLKNSKQHDLIVVGDFNDTPKREKNNTLNVLKPRMIFLTEEMKSCKYPSAYVIDQIVVSPQTYKRLIKDSEQVYDIYSFLSDQQLKGLSDHCPVIANFDVTAPDEDGKVFARK